MGYYTNYTLDCYDKYGIAQDISLSTELGAKLTAALHRISPNYFDDDFNLMNLPYQEWKWYDHEEDVLALSNEFPEYTFILEGEGEDHYDTWRMIYHAGDYELITPHLVYSAPLKDFSQIVYDIYDDVEE